MKRISAILVTVLALSAIEPAWAVRDPSEDSWSYTGDWNKPGKPKEGTQSPTVDKVKLLPGLVGPQPGYRPRGLAPAPEDPAAIAVVIANARYRNGIPQVDYALNDGRMAQEMMRDIFGVRPGNIIMLENAGQADLFSVFGNERSHEGKLWSWIRPGRSKVYVYYSGHGVPGVRDGRAYILPVDADPGTAEINGYPLELLYRNLTKLGVRSVTVMLEACFSGLTERGPLIRSASPVFVKSAQPLVSSGITVLSASQNDQIASWDHGARLGLFTHYLSRALYGEADGGRWGDGDGKVTLGEIEAFLDEEMTYAARRLHQRVQQPSLAGDRQLVLAKPLAGDGRAGRGRDSRDRDSGTTRTSSAPVARVGSLAGHIVPPDGSLAAAGAFIVENRRSVDRAIAAYYRVKGKVWDQATVHSSGIEVERLKSINEMKTVAAAPGTIDLFVAYGWAGDSGDGFGEANMRLKIDAEGISVSRMWR